MPNEDGGKIIPILTSNRFTPLLASEIMNENGEWDIEHLRPFIKDSDFQAIKAIPIGRDDDNDVAIWPFNKKGQFTVSSGYRRIRSKRRRRSRCKASSSHLISKAVWKIIWSPSLLPKISNFLWKALSGSLPLAWNLFKRKVAANPLCTVCGVEQETVEHCLFFCPWTVPVWFGGPANYSPSKHQITTLDN